MRENDDDSSRTADMMTAMLAAQMIEAAMRQATPIKVLGLINEPRAMRYQLIISQMICDVVSLCAPFMSDGNDKSRLLEIRNKMLSEREALQAKLATL